MFDFDFWVFIGEMGKTNFGSGDKVRPLQISSWGEVGECLDALDWIYGRIRLTRS